MEFPPEIPPHLLPDAERMRDQAHARHAMHHGIAAALMHARKYVDHRDALWVPKAHKRYDMAEFLLRTQTMSQVHAEDYLFAQRTTAPSDSVRVVIVIADWLNSARGHGNPELHEPNWVRVWETEARKPLEFPPVDNAIAVAAYGRHPSLVRLDWDWCGIYPFATPSYKTPALAEHADASDAEGQAAA